MRKSIVLLKPEIYVPMLLILVIVAITGYATYFQPKGPWYLVVYPDKNQHAFVEASHVATAIVDHSEAQNTATAYIPHTASLQKIRQNGGILLDPTGVPLCLTN